MKKISLIYIYIIMLLFQEFLFKSLIFQDFLDVSTINIIIYTIFISLIIYLISSGLNEKQNKTLLYIITGVTSVWFAFQFCIYKMFKSFFTFSILGASGQLLDFTGDIMIHIWNNLVYILLFFVPLILVIIFRKKIKVEKFNFNIRVFTIVGIIISFMIFNLSLLIDKEDNLSSYELYYEMRDNGLSMKKFGVTNFLHQDLIKTIFDYEAEVTLTPNKTPGSTIIDPDDLLVEYEYNTLDIDFDSMTSSNSNVNLLNDYFKLDLGTKQNEYTKMFEDKNLIFIMAESYNEIALDKDRTPTLYKLVNEGFNFENFYSPTIYSTIGGEFQMLTGLYPSSGFVTEFKKSGETYPFGLADMFENEGYTTYAYHNNTYSFQNRNNYLKDMGFDNYKACGNGLEDLINCTWIQSDIEMMENTIDEYVSDEKFMTYYVSVSGHGDYSTSGAISKKYVDLVEDGYSNKTTGYLAAQIELDRAVESLIKNLELNNKLEDTVIVLASDHHPYYLSIDEINEASDYEKDSLIEVDRSNLIIWNSEMESEKIEKVGNTTDILPTVYNLFGIDYDSRLMTGKDILSTEPGLAIFNNSSWVSDYGYYFASSNSFVQKENVILPDNYVEDMNNLVKTRTNLSSLIINNNYYDILNIKE